MATAASKSKTTGFAVPCPKCGAVDGLSVKVHDLSVECSECSEGVTRDDLQQLIDDARRLMAWLDLAATL